MSIRPATESDLDAITWIAVAALPGDPGCLYRFPYMHIYPEDYAKHTRIRLGEYMAAGDSAIMVFESPSLEDPTVTKPVTFSVWQLPGTHVKKGTGSEATQKRPKTNRPRIISNDETASAARMTAFRQAITRTKAEWFDGRYGEKQAYLAMLACHPDYQKRGAGEMLCW